MSRVENCAGEGQEYRYQYEDSLFLHQLLTPEQAVYTLGTDNSGGLESLTTPLGHTTTFGIRPTLGVFTLYMRAPWVTVAYQLDAGGRVLSRHVGNHVTEFLAAEEQRPLDRKWITKTMELVQDVNFNADNGGWWVNHTSSDKLFKHYLVSAFQVAADGAAIRNLQQLETGSEVLPHVDYTCRKSTKDYRVDCEGKLLNQPIEYSVAYDRTNQLPASVNGFEVTTGLQTTVFRHVAQGLQVSRIRFLNLSSNYFFLSSGVYIGGTVSPFLRFYCFFSL